VRFFASLVFAIAPLSMLVACGGAPSSPSVSASVSAPSSTPAALAAAAALAPGPSTEWQCGGDLVPPSGWQQETAFSDVSTPNALSVAGTDASSKLVTRLCASSGGTGCDYLTAHVRLWKTGSSAKTVCAMAVIKSDEVAEWRAMSSTLSTLDDKLAAAVRELLKGVPAKNHVAIDQVVDRGVPGGVRADWLRGRAERFLAQAATLVAVPKKWAGDGVPDGVDVVIGGSVVSRQEQGVPTLEAIWTARFRNGRRVPSTPVTFPEQAAPTAPTESAPSIAASAGVSIRVESARGGSLCAGERTQLWLKTDSPMYVRVFDLFGAGEAIVIYPGDDQPSARIDAGQAIPLGGRLGFEAVPVPGFEAERYVVVAAPTEQALGRFAKAKGQCRVPPDVARSLALGEVPPGVKVATTGYRITTGAACPTYTEPREGVVAAVASLPLCAF